MMSASSRGLMGLVDLGSLWNRGGIITLFNPCLLPLIVSILEPSEWQLEESPSLLLCIGPGDKELLSSRLSILPVVRLDVS